MRHLTISLPLVFLFSSCDTRKDPTLKKQVSVTGIKIISMPNTNNGTSWDDSSFADISVGVENGEKVIYDSGIVLDDFDITQSKEIEIENYTLPTVDYPYTVTLWDIDSANKELIGSVSFNPSDHSLAESAILSSADIKICLYLRWGH